MADHELATSTMAVRVAASTRADVYDALLAGLATLAGPLHGGASQLAYSLLDDAQRHGVEQALNDTLRWQRVLPGFGHTVYKNGDARFTVLLQLFEQLAPPDHVELVGSLIDVARAHTIPLPNVDLGLAAIAWSTGMGPGAGRILFTVARVAGWVAHYLEELGERPLRYRARAIYASPGRELIGRHPHMGWRRVRRSGRGTYDRPMTLPAPNPDRTCLVTGASSGIGAEIASLLAARGLGVTLVARSQATLEKLARELGSRNGVRAEWIVADLTEEASRSAIADELATRSLMVNVLVNNAGFSTMGPVHRSDPAAELAMVRTDVEAVVHLCTLFLPGMVERRSGCVLNVASTAAFQPLPGQAAYGASKAFVLSYSHALRGEVRGTGATVTVLCPGPVATGFAAAAGISDEEAAQAMPRFMWVPADEVAKAAVAGMDADRAVVIPGMANRISAAAGWLSPGARWSPWWPSAIPRSGPEQCSDTPVATAGRR